MPNLLDEIINYPKPLSPDQKAAVLCKSKYVKVIAGAGAGKTETLTRRIAYLITVEKIKPSAIVAFTFTERAARSMKERIYERVEHLLGEESLASLGEMYIGTIHAYAKRLLEDRYRFGIHQLLDDNQELAFLLREGWEMGLGGGNYSENCQNFLRTFNMSLDEELEEKDLTKEAPDFSHKRSKYLELLNKHKLLTFGTVISYAVSKLKEVPQPLNDIKYLIVDEYQDINKAQFELIKLIGKKAAVFVVGDPRQSIYQWRGSDERYFDEFNKHFKNAQVVTIKENRRSGTNIVKNANKFSASFSAKFERMAAINSETGLVAVQALETPETEAKWITDQVEALVKANNLRYRDIGILTRSVSTSARELIEEFKSRKIRYVVGGKVGLFKRDDALSLAQIFTWLYDGGWWHENGKTLKGDELVVSALVHWNVAQPYGVPKDARRRLEKIKANLYSAKPSYPYTTELFQDILFILGFLNLSHSKPDDAVVIANVGRFNNILSDYEAANMLGGDLPNWPKRLKGLFWFIQNASGAYEERSIFEIGDVDAVQIMTVHQAKGLEWPVVFVFSLTDRRFPSSMTGRESDWCGIPTSMFDVKRYQGTPEDERRLFYVAITRPKDVLVLSYFKHQKNAATRSRFLDNIDLTAVRELKEGEPLPKAKAKRTEEKEEMQTYSASDVILYSRCPYQFLLRNLWGYQPKINEYIGYGKALHFCLSQAKEIIDSGKRPNVAIVSAVADGFFLPYVGAGIKADKIKDAAEKTLVSFALKHEEDLKRIKEVEYRIEFPLNKTTIIGKVDVIINAEGGEEVRDYKTSDQITTTEEFAMQVKLYTMGLRGLGRNVTSGSIAYLENGEIASVDLSKESLQKSKSRAQEIVDGIGQNSFGANIGEHCKKCDMLRICKYYQATVKSR